MIRFMIVALALALGLVWLSCASASGTYPDGYVNSDGYTWKNGFWWKGEYPYTREKVYNPQSYYYSYGYYYPLERTYYWSYSRAAVYYPPVPATPTYSQNWQSELLAIAKQRDTFEGKARAAAQDHQAYLEAVQALGLTGNFRWNGYGQYSPYPGGNFAFPQYGGYGANGVGSYGASGNTLYGYSVQTLKDYYGSTDLNALYQAASRLTQGAQGLAGQAHTEFSQLVGQAGDNAGRVAEILARSQAAANALNATDPQARTRESSSTTVIRSGTGTPPAVPLPDPPVTGVTLAPANAQTFIQKVGGPQCGQCHGDTDPKGKFKISDYPKMTPEEKGKVIFRLTTLDKSKMMPRLASGEPGQPVSRETLIEFLRH